MIIVPFGRLPNSQEGFDIQTELLFFFFSIRTWLEIVINFDVSSSLILFCVFFFSFKTAFLCIMLAALEFAL